MVSGPGKIGRRSLGWEGFRVRVWTRFESREEGMGSGVPVRGGRKQRHRQGKARQTTRAREIDGAGKENH